MPVNFLDNTEEESFFGRAEVKTICAVVFFVPFFFYMMFMSSEPKMIEQFVDNFKKEEIIGVVNEKALDSANRNNPFFKVYRHKYYPIQPMWDKISVGDSIFKLKNTSDFHIIKKDTTIIIYAEDVKKHLDSLFAND